MAWMLPAAMFAGSGLTALTSQRPKQFDYKAMQRIMDLLQQRYTALQPQMQQQFYNQWLGSPAYQQGQNASWAAGNQLQNDLGASLGARGLGTSGVAAMAGPLSRYAASTFNTQLRAGGWNQAQTSSLDFLRSLMSAQGGMMGTMSQAGQGQPNNWMADLLGPLAQFAMLKYMNQPGQPKKP